MYAELLLAHPLTFFYSPPGPSASSPNGSYDTAGSCRCRVAPPRSLSQRSVAACFAALCHAGNARLPHPGQSQSSWYRRGDVFHRQPPQTHLHRKKQGECLSSLIIKKHVEQLPSLLSTDKNDSDCFEIQ